MPDCFISYSARDERLAKVVYITLRHQGITAFMASVSIDPGEHWSSKVLEELRRSSWVIFLASRDACKSAYVQQELGAAIGSRKKLVPVVWEIDPSELPGWVNRFQAIDIRGKTIFDLMDKIKKIAQSIKQDKQTGVAILGAVLLAVALFGGSGRK